MSDEESLDFEQSLTFIEDESEQEKCDRLLKGKRKPSSTSSDNSPQIQLWKKQDKKKHRGCSADNLKTVESVEKMDISVALEEIKTKLNVLATKEELKSELDSAISRFSLRVDQLECRIFDVEKENDNLREEIKQLKLSNDSLEKKIRGQDDENLKIRKLQNDHEQYLRRWNVRVFKVPEQANESAEQCIEKCADIFVNKIGVPVAKEDIEVAHRVGTIPPVGRPRPIIVKFLSRQKRDLVIFNRKNLKNKGVSVGEDLTAVNYRLLREAETHSATLAAWSSHGKIKAKLKNGKTVIVEPGTDVKNKLDKEMTVSGK